MSTSRIARNATQFLLIAPLPVFAVIRTCSSESGVQPTSYVNFDLPDVDAHVAVFRTRTSGAACGVFLPSLFPYRVENVFRLR